MRQDESSIYQIDRGKLHEEWERQAKLFKLEADKLADAKEEYETAKARRDLVKAEMEA
jgi:hypothetical protein